MANWEHKKLTIDEIKAIVTDVYDGKTFTSLQCDGISIMTCFMPMLFLGSAPSSPSITGDIKKDRKNKLLHIDALEVYKNETPDRLKFIENIGMVYENIDSALPRAINGMPCFSSCKIVSKEDAQMFCDMYNKYIKKRKEFEKEW